MSKFDKFLAASILFVVVQSASSQTCSAIEFAELQTYSVDELKKQFCTAQLNMNYQAQRMVPGPTWDSASREIDKCMEQMRRVQRLLNSKGAEQKGAECSK